MPAVPEKRPDAAFPGLKVCLRPGSNSGAQALEPLLYLQHIPYIDMPVAYLCALLMVLTP